MRLTATVAIGVWAIWLVLVVSVARRLPATRSRCGRCDSAGGRVHRGLRGGRRRFWRGRRSGWRPTPAGHREPPRDRLVGEQPFADVDVTAVGGRSPRISTPGWPRLGCCRGTASTRRRAPGGILLWGMVVAVVILVRLRCVVPEVGSGTSGVLEDIRETCAEWSPATQQGRAAGPAARGLTVPENAQRVAENSPFPIAGADGP